MAAMEKGMHSNQHETPWQVDFQALDRRERLIIKRMLAGLALGMVLAVAGESLAEVLPPAVTMIYDPYVYGLLVLVMTRSSANAWWAALNGLLATAGLTAGHVVAHALNHGETLITQANDSWQIALSVTLVGFGVAGYLSRRSGLGGDVAVGVFTALICAEGQEIQRASLVPHGVPPPNGTWPVVALVLLGVGLPLLLRPTVQARLRTLLIAVGCAAVLLGVSLL
ncbi:hypothetical protein [Streptosporangium saharense]|uniref:hypothetical protein n=1 Tax=Streptosporangium saharense TaxID=1706840 RepID=UPI003328B24F